MARSRPQPKKTLLQKVWAVLNSPFGIAILTLVVIGGGAGLYKQYQDDLQDRTERRATLGKLLTEYQRRVSALGAADSELDGQLGPSGTWDQTRRLDRNDRAAVARWEALSARIDAREWDVLTGRGSYVPTAPEFASVSFLNVASQLENTAGIPDIQFGGLRAIGLLEVPPPGTYIFVRAYLRFLIQWGAARHFLYMNQTLPLSRGALLTPTQERQLGIPQPRPGDLERLQRENDILHNRIQNDLRATSEAEAR